MVGYLVVLVVAAVVGVGVYWVSMRLISDEAAPDVAEWQGTGLVPPEPGAAPQAQPSIPMGTGGSYIPVSAGSPSWQARVGGIMGLVVAVGVASLMLAFALYEAGTMIARLMSHAATT